MLALRDVERLHALAPVAVGRYTALRLLVLLTLGDLRQLGLWALVDVLKVRIVVEVALRNDVLP